MIIFLNMIKTIGMKKVVKDFELILVLTFLGMTLLTLLFSNV
jgi:hypothetical protein